MLTRAAGTICFDGALANPCPKMIASSTDEANTCPSSETRATTTVTVSPFPSRADVCPSKETARTMPHFMAVPTSIQVCSVHTCPPIYVHVYVCACVRVCVCMCVCVYACYSTQYLCDLKCTWRAYMCMRACVCACCHATIHQHLINNSALLLHHRAMLANNTCRRAETLQLLATTTRNLRSTSSWKEVGN